jgi:hypothetical protein
MSRKLARDRRKIAASRGKRTTGEYHRFDPASYAAHNAPGIAAVLDYLDSIGLYAVENEDFYGPDIVVWKGFQPAYYIEVARRSHWESGDWPDHWDPIHVEERKWHLFNSLQFPCEYWIVRLDGKAALIVPENVLSGCEDIREIPNSRLQSGEKFLCIPLEQCIEKNLEPERGTGDDIPQQGSSNSGVE